MTIDRHLIYKGAPVGTAPTGDARPAGREISVKGIANPEGFALIWQILKDLVRKLFI